MGCHPQSGRGRKKYFESTIILFSKNSINEGKIQTFSDEDR